MMENLVDMRFSDTDFCAYLLLNGYEISYIEISDNKRHIKPKAFTHFIGNKDTLLNLKSKYENEKVNVNIIEFSHARRYLNNNIKKLLELHKTNKESKSVVHPARYNK